MKVALDFQHLNVCTPSNSNRWSCRLGLSQWFNWLSTVLRDCLFFLDSLKLFPELSGELIFPARFFAQLPCFAFCCVCQTLLHTDPASLAVGSLLSLASLHLDATAATSCVAMVQEVGGTQSHPSDANGRLLDIGH